VFLDWGIRCRQCGRFLTVLAQAIPELPDPLPVTCPYCGYSASYPKSAISCAIAMPDVQTVVRWGPVVLAAITIILLLIATRAHAAEVTMRKVVPADLGDHRPRLPIAIATEQR
jgi:hypothetical protein